MDVSAVPNIKHYINGEFLEADSNEMFSNISPFTNKEINQVAKGSEVDIDIAVAAARDAFKHGPWREMPVKERLNYIKKIADLIRRGSRGNLLPRVIGYRFANQPNQKTGCACG